MSAVPVGVQAPLRNALIRIRARLESVPYALLAIPLRVAVATVFWDSGTTKLASWETTLALFRDEYRLPLIPPDIAATMAASVELSTPFLLVFGLFTRAAALVLLGDAPAGDHCLSRRASLVDAAAADVLALDHDCPSARVGQRS